MNKLVEELFSSVFDDDVKKDDVVKAQAALDPTYADAINEHERTKKELEGRFKEQNNNCEDFVKNNHNTDFKPKAPKEFKKMKLSESLFESVFTETTDLGDPLEMGRGACTPLIPNYSQDIQNYIKHYGEDPREDNFIRKGLKRYAESLEDSRKEIDAFNEYWTARYPAMIKCLDAQLDMIPEDIKTELAEFLDGSIEINPNINVTATGNDVPVLNTSLGEDTELEEAATTVPSNIYYKKKRDPLADIIMQELTSGEVVYSLNDKGKFIPTWAPSLNLDEMEVGASSDENGEYIIAHVGHEEDLGAVEDIARKYGKQFKSGMDRYAIGNKYFTKIYVNDEDWDEPYFDPDAQVRSSGHKKHPEED
jgi:hypothetical protein